MLPIVIGFDILALALVFAWVFLDCWGIPGAGIAIMGTAALAGNIPSLLIVIGTVYLAAILGDIGAYSFARIISKPLLTKLRKLSFFKNNEEKAREKLVKYEFQLIFFSRFAMGSLSPVMNYIAGIEKISKIKFLIAALTGELMYATLFSTAGYLFGATAYKILGEVNWAIIAIVIILLIFTIVRYSKKKKSQKK